MALQMAELDRTLQTWMSKNGIVRQLELMLQESREVTGRDISQLEQRLIGRLEEQQMISTARHLSTTSQLQDLQWSTAMQYMSSSVLVDPILCLKHCKARYKQLLTSGTPPPMSTYSKDLSQRLQTWADSSESGFIYLRGTPLARGISQGLAIEMVELLRSKGAPVIWALNSRQKGHNSLTRVEVLKHLVLQLFQINQDIQRSSPVTTAALYAARDEEHWFRVMAEALSGMSSVFLIFDLDILDSADDSGFDWSQAFIGLFEQLRRNGQTVIRISFISCKYASLPPTSGGGKYSMDIVPISSRSQIQNMTQSPLQKKKIAVQRSARASRRTKEKGTVLVILK
jgi:hypothetical protein